MMQRVRSHGGGGTFGGGDGEAIVEYWISYQITPRKSQI